MKKISVFLIICIFAAFLVGYFAADWNANGKKKLGVQVEKIDGGITKYEKINGMENWIAIKTLQIPAIAPNGKGVLVDLAIRLEKGEGKVFFSVGNGTISPETQMEMLRAARVAENATGNSLGQKNVYIQIDGGDGQYVTGRSIGVAGAILVMAILEGRQLKEDITITGNLDEEGNIGRVGFVLEKAASLIGTKYQTFLVPVGEKKEFVVPDGCRREDGSVATGCKPEKELADVEERTGIKVIEVTNINQAYEMMVV